jgi:hypothetical protein
MDILFIAVEPDILVIGKHLMGDFPAVPKPFRIERSGPCGRIRHEPSLLQENRGNFYR